MDDRDERRPLEDKAGVVYLMRGLPSSGKSYTALRLAGDIGVVCETDAFFRRAEANALGRSGIRAQQMERARQWNFERFVFALDSGASPVIVDRGNGLSRETARYATLALDKGYRVEFREPESAWWQEIRVLLKYHQLTEPILRIWADRLADLSLTSHSIPSETIWSQMCAWRHDLRVEDILSLNGAVKVGTDDAAAIGPKRGAESASMAVRRAKALSTSSRNVAAEPSRRADKDWLREFLSDAPGDPDKDG